MKKIELRKSITLHPGKLSVDEHDLMKDDLLPHFINSKGSKVKFQLLDDRFIVMNDLVDSAMEKARNGSEEKEKKEAIDSQVKAMRKLRKDIFREYVKSNCVIDYFQPNMGKSNDFWFWFISESIEDKTKHGTVFYSVYGSILEPLDNLLDLYDTEEDNDIRKATIGFIMNNEIICIFPDKPDYLYKVGYKSDENRSMLTVIKVREKNE